MQCKARGRNCVSSKSDLTPDPNENNTVNTSSPSPKSQNDSYLFSCSKPTIKTHSKPSQFHIDFNHESLTSLSSFGKLTQWKQEPPLPSKYSHAIEMPSLDIQMTLINHFFEKRYMTTPVLPKRLFFKHLHSKGPLITPLLLNAIYCLSSKSTSLKDIPKPYVFFNRARKLLDDFLDTPRISTVAALYLMSLYEPTDSASVDHHCRSWIYNGMASRMAIELGLNVDTPFTHNSMSDEEVELRRRVFWHCYCFDKCISTEWQRVWSISTSLAKSSLPRILPEDDPQEQLAVRVLQEKIKLSMINELGLHLKAAYMLHGHVTEETYHQQLESYLEKLLKWRDNVAETWQFSLPTTMQDILDNPSRRFPGVGHVLSIFYYMLCDVLLCLPVNPQRLKDRRVYAAAYIKSVEHWFDEPDSLYRCEFVATGLVSAARIHACFFNDQDPEVVRQSQQLIRECTHLLEKLQTMTAVPECTAIVKNIVQMMDNSDSPSTSPTVSVGSTHEQQQPPYLVPMYMDLWQYPAEKYLPYSTIPTSGFVNSNNNACEQTWDPSPNVQYYPYAPTSNINVLNQPYYPNLQ